MGVGRDGNGRESGQTGTSAGCGATEAEKWVQVGVMGAGGEMRVRRYRAEVSGQRVPGGERKPVNRIDRE